MKHMGIAANGRHSVHDFGNPYASSSIGDPAMKVIRQTVPHMSGYYDYTALGGEPCYESRTISYEFEVIASGGLELHREVDRFIAWLHGIHETEIYDDEIIGYHFVGTANTPIEPDYDEFGTKAVISVSFTCQPFKLANNETEVSIPIGEAVIHNNGRRVLLSASSDGACILTIGNASQSFTGEAELDLALAHGDNAVTVAGSACTLKWREAVI